MSYNKVILLLGTNLGDKEINLKTAHEHISQRIGEIIKFSEIMETKPIGFISENNFLNQCILIETALSPISLLKEVKSIENSMGRVYKKLKLNEGENRYEDRLIDIDVLNFNKINFRSKVLTLPHPQIESRNFVKLLCKF